MLQCWIAEQPSSLLREVGAVWLDVIVMKRDNKMWHEIKASLKGSVIMKSKLTFQGILKEVYEIKMKSKKTHQNKII